MIPGEWQRTACALLDWKRDGFGPAKHASGLWGVEIRPRLGRCFSRGAQVQAEALPCINKSSHRPHPIGLDGLGLPGDAASPLPRCVWPPTLPFPQRQPLTPVVLVDVGPGPQRTASHFFQVARCCWWWSLLSAGQDRTDRCGCRGRYQDARRQESWELQRGVSDKTITPRCFCLMRTLLCRLQVVGLGSEQEFILRRVQP